jgi:hypothetical protein
LCALGLVGFGLFCVFTALSSPHVYTTHSWMGLSTALLLALQALGGVIYLFPHGQADIKAALLPSHAWLGLTTWVLAMLTVCTGVMNLSGYLLYGGGGGRMVAWSGESIVAALLGLVVYATLLFGLYAAMPRRAVAWEGEETGEMETGGAGVEGRRRRTGSIAGKYGIRT